MKTRTSLVSNSSSSSFIIYDNIDQSKKLIDLFISNGLHFNLSFYFPYDTAMNDVITAHRLLFENNIEYQIESEGGDYDFLDVGVLNILLEDSMVVYNSTPVGNPEKVTAFKNIEFLKQRIEVLENETS